MAKNEDILFSLNQAIKALVTASQNIESSMRDENPSWRKAVDLLDSCTDDLREFQSGLTTETPSKLPI